MAITHGSRSRMSTGVSPRFCPWPTNRSRTHPPRLGRGVGGGTLGVSMVELATVHELGTATIPARHPLLKASTATSPSGAAARAARVRCAREGSEARGGDGQARAGDRAGRSRSTSEAART